MIGLAAPTMTPERALRGGVSSSVRANSLQRRDPGKDYAGALLESLAKSARVEAEPSGIFFGSDARDNVHMARFDRELRREEHRFSRRLRGWLILTAAVVAWGATLLVIWGGVTLFALVFPGAP